MTLECDLDLEYRGHHYTLRSRSDNPSVNVLDLTVPGLTAVLALTRQTALGLDLCTLLRQWLPQRSLEIRVWLGKRRLAWLDFAC